MGGRETQAKIGFQQGRGAPGGRVVFWFTGEVFVPETEAQQKPAEQKPAH